MQIDKSQLLELLRSHGQGTQADSAADALPDQVDTDKDAGLLASHGIDVQQLLGLLASSGLADKLPGGLGGLLGGSKDGEKGGGLGGLLG